MVTLQFVGGKIADGNSPVSAGYDRKGGDFEITVNLGASDWATPIDHIERYFLTGGFVIVNSLGWNRSNRSTIPNHWCY